MIYLKKRALAFGFQKKFAPSWIRIHIFHVNPDADPGGKSFADPDPKRLMECL
jgi:hypothetical protein